MRHTGNERRRSARFAATAALGLLIAAVPIGSALAASGAAADGGKTDYVWSTDLDCALCHEAQAASMGAAGAQATQAETAEQDAAEKPADSTDAKTGENVEAADGSTDGAAPAPTDAPAADDGHAAAIMAYAAMHATDLSFDCFTCHSDAEGLEAAHDAKKLNSGKEARRLKKTEVSSEFCQGCHDQKALAEATADYQGIVDKGGLVVNPHDLPQNDSHADLKCVNCHEAHPKEGSTIQDQAMNQCISCHHAEVFECGTCH